MGHTVALSGDPGARVMYGWNVLGMPYAHARRIGSTSRTFAGPWALHRAVRWLARTPS